MNKLLIYLCIVCLLIISIAWFVTMFTDYDLKKFGFDSYYQVEVFKTSTGGIIKVKKKKVVINIDNVVLREAKK